MAPNRILIVDDDPLQRWGFREHLTSWNYLVFEADTAAAAFEEYRTHSPDLVLLDLRLGGESGLDVLKNLRGLDPSAAVIMITAHGDVDDAVNGFRLGLVDFFSKPVDFDALRVALRYRLETGRLREIVGRRREAEATRAGIVGQSSSLQASVRIMEKVAASEATTVLLQGESGTGKDLMAKALHACSSRRDQPFVAVNCAALPDALLESELFGHERGAFTDARAMKRGVLELADGGTLYLDEVGELKLPLQAKLLRVLEDLTFRRVGGVHDIRVDTRVIAASNRDLGQAVRDGLFRPDLYYRLGVIQIPLPPLRERREDIPLLVEHFVTQLARRLRRPVAGVTLEAMTAMCQYHWPGNVRELRNAIERAIILEDGDRLTLTHLALPSTRPAALGGQFVLPAEGVSLERVEQDLVRQAIQLASGNQTRAARLLDISRDALRYKLKKFGLAGHEPDDPVLDAAGRDGGAAEHAPGDGSTPTE